jgi:LAS superfamily LD-carboxypeptidase LdcB
MLDSKGVPLELLAYGNGTIPAGALHQVGDTRHRLWTPAAQSLTALIADARRDGVSIGVTDSYRSYAEQVDLVRRKGLYSQGGLAAKPGTSDHGWGMAADLDLNSKAQAWMRANGAKYGFEEDTPREPWHWAYTPHV